MEVKMKINWPLRTKIVEKYRTNIDFAQSLGVSETLVSKIIRGRRKLDFEKQIIWAKALGCNPTDIFPDED
jgi:plasmid maintenance system antidote protein VapI